MKWSLHTSSQCPQTATTKTSVCNAWFSDFNTLPVWHSETRAQNANATQYLTHSETVFCTFVHQCITLRLENFDTFTRSNLEIQDEGNVALCRAYSRVWVPQSVEQRFGLLRCTLPSTNKSLYVVGTTKQLEDWSFCVRFEPQNVSTHARNSKHSPWTLDMDEKKSETSSKYWTDETYEVDGTHETWRTH